MVTGHKRREAAKGHNMSTGQQRFLYTSLLALLLVQQPAMADAPLQAHWFYMVKSRPSEPVREDEYNAWYEDIDIPDVLAVPGFERARRAIARDSTETAPTDATYVALYDIDTPDIDKSIIDLYVAARKMSQLGRLTDVLKVVEANYYELIATGNLRGDPAPGRPFVFTQKILCCEDPIARERFLGWYGDTLQREVIESIGATRTQLYELYRVMEVVALQPYEIPHFMMIFEANAESAADLVARFEALLMDVEGNANYAGGDRVVYEVISEAVK